MANEGLMRSMIAGPGSHYCDNIARSHASNHVYLVADFAKGVFAQKCHDPDCGGFRCLPFGGIMPKTQSLRTWGQHISLSSSRTSV